MCILTFQIAETKMSRSVYEGISHLEQTWGPLEDDELDFGLAGRESRG
jgi:hypothetical protein